MNEEHPWWVTSGPVGAALAVAALSCSGGCSSEQAEPVPEGGIGCTVLFGAPNENTGLDETSCQPRCACGDVDWQPPVYTPSDIDGLRQHVLLDPPELLGDEDPYQNPEAHVPQPDAVCAVVPDAQQAGAYRVQTFADRQQAEQAGATTTHCGACGRCSSLEDLAAYMSQPDLTQPVRACALEGMSEGKDRNIECLQELGFTLPSRPGMYQLDVTLVGHVHESTAPPADGERGEEIRLEAPTVHIKAS